MPSNSSLSKLVAGRVRGFLSGRRSEIQLPPAEELRRRIHADRYLRHHYEHAYRLLRSLVNSAPQGPVIEIGAGSGISSDLIPRVITTDIEHSGAVQVALDARDLPFPDESIAGVIMKDALHHIPDPERLLQELQRVVAPGGVVAIMDPYWGLLARAIYRWLHPEPFDDQVSDWKFESAGPHDSNQAILKLMLGRDRARVASILHDFNVVEHGPTLGPSFLFSGGLHGRTAIPSGPLVKVFDWENRQGRWLDPFRFEFVVSFRKKTADE